MLKSKVKTICFLVSLIAFCFTSVQVLAQKLQDSLALSQARWEQRTVDKGITLKTASMELFDSRQQITITVIQPKKHKIIFVQPEGRHKTSEQAIQHGAKAAINAGFFNMQFGGPVDFIKVDKKVLAQSSPESFTANGAVVKNGKKIDIVPWSAEIEAQELTRPKYKNVLVSKVILMDEGEIVPIDSTQFATLRHPRSVIGVNDKKEVFFMVVDGRHEDRAAGMSLFELAWLCKQLGMTDALNLDGGGSSTLWVHTEGIVNYPSDNKTFDHQGERTVNNIIIAR